MKTTKCTICGSERIVKNKEYCHRCSRRIITWGYEGSKLLYELANSGIDLDIKEIAEFCTKYYIGLSKRLHVKCNTFKISINILGYKGKIIGRLRKYSDYEHVRKASTHRICSHKDNKCYECGSTENLKAHHIVPTKWGGSYFAPTESITLCDKCHRLYHKRLNRILSQDLLIQYLSPWQNDICKRARSTVTHKDIPNN